MPANYYVAQSKLGGFNGLYCRVPIEKGHFIGEYVGEILRPSRAAGRQSDYQFIVRDGVKIKHVIDAVDPTQSSFLRYVNAANTIAQQNSKYVQHNMKIYLKATKMIPANREILAWYGDETNNIVGY
jgi:hypothetical protein